MADRMITREEFAAQALELSREANVVDGFHGYFVAHGDRLYQSCVLFDLLDRKLGAALEVGPFYGYTPFLLRPNADSYTVLEGDDPAAYPLKPLYEKRRITLQFVDFFESFGPSLTATHSLPLRDASFDTVLCWETMEHFNFNPVKFVRELHRVLKPGGQVCITVPNSASFQSILGLVSGRAERGHIDNYFKFEDYISNGKKAYYGFHWREYSRFELGRLFAQAGFKVRRCDTFVAFQAHASTSIPRRLVRVANVALAGVLRRYGTHVYLIAEK
jgi:SAM-dependent methyltransferase